MKTRWIAGLTVAMLALARVGSATGVANLSLSVTGPGLTQAGVNLSYSITRPCLLCDNLPIKCLHLASIIC
jgi:hypothetical protein